MSEQRFGMEAEPPFTLCKFMHQKQYFCWGLAFYLCDNGVPVPLKPQMFDNWFSGEVFW